MHRVLIKALKEHAQEFSRCDEYSCYDAEVRGYKTCSQELTKLAADALEAAEKRIDGLQKLVDINTERCEALRKQLRKSHESYEKRIAELEGQLPKEGEWVRNDKEQDGFADVVWRYAKCTVCGDSRFSYYAARKNFRYCPSCGARMKDHANAD